MSRRTQTRTALLLAGVVLLASFGAGLLWRGSIDSAEANRHRKDLADLDPLAVRVEMTRALLDEVTLRILEPFDVVDPEILGRSTDDRLEIVAAGQERLTAIASQRGPRGGQARQILDEFEQWGPADRNAGVFELYNGADVAQFEAAPPPASPATTTDSIAELLWLDQAATFTLHEALIAEHHRSPRSATEEIAEFLEDPADFVADGGGYLGPDPQAPLTEGWIFTDTAFAATSLAAAVHCIWRRSDEIRQKVNLDPLTGAGNRHLLQTRTTELLATQRLTDHAVVMIDMDRFKITNDTYGHAAGDRLLQELSHGLRRIADSALASEPTVIHLGGDEFALTLHHHQLINEGILAAAKELRPDS
ncbi:MAG: GGDEF domain-containing protein [Acidimicrobiales bacterium]|jgi:GGDEF domain-containing protein